MKPSKGISAMARILALDFGSRHIGVAISDELLISTRPLSPLSDPSPKKQLEEIDFLCQNFSVKTIVIGHPLSLDKTVGPQARIVEEFAAQVAALTGRPVVLWDETYTTTEAEAQMRSQGKDPRKQRAEVNSLAAQQILNSYLQDLATKNN